ncbi:hypothetical protein BDV23DRAFT_168808 [Aspergillus alliaceus]|uniref:Transcription factor domain-containing protein n=1 Tax=Petromyces alliaceus TaxID=209559 RepID=A0A5N7CM41_PETAA|nr:hypothetical protein BDV23DRAFT_168808 [Aspergillus alliaceus]
MTSRGWFSLSVDQALPLDLASHDLDFSTLDMVRPSVMEELPLQELSDFQPRNAALPPSDITELYKRNQLPEMDKDAVESRHYDPTYMNAVPIENVEAENLAHVEEVPVELTDIVFQLASQMQLNSNYPQSIELSIPPAHVLNAWGANACLKAMHELIRRYTSYTLRNCLPQSESRWNASSAQNWAIFGEGNGGIQCGQKLGTPGKQTILQYLTNIVKDKGDISPGSPTFSLEERNEAMKVLEGLLEETRDECYGFSLSEVKASAIHRVMILSALTNYHTPTSDIISHAIKVIYGKMDDSSWTQIIDRCSLCVHVFETIRSARCTHFITPVHFLRAALVLWLYATIYDRLRQGREYQFQVPMVVLDFKSLNTTATKQWVSNGSSCIKLARVSNLLNRNGRCKILEDSVVIMRSLKAWGISTMYAQLLARVLDAENMRTA